VVTGHAFFLEPAISHVYRPKKFFHRKFSLFCKLLCIFVPLKILNQNQ